MELFKDFDAVKFLEENLILITRNGFIYYIYDNKYWWKHHNAGNDHITVEKYQDISKEELTRAMNGLFPQKETDFMRLCKPSQLSIMDMLDLLEEDYARYMSDHLIYNTIHCFLLESDICFKSFLALKKLLDNAVVYKYDNQQVITEVRKLCFNTLGRDIFKKEIRIVDGHDSSSYFWIMPVRIIDYSNTDSMNNVAEMRSNEISIEEYDIDKYLAPFLLKYFDDELEANKKRLKDYWVDDEGNEHATAVCGFEWNLTYNYFTYDSIRNILKDIQDTVDALNSNRVTEFTKEIVKFDADKREEDETDLIVDFYNRFIYRMEYMLRVGEEKGYNLISFMGP